MWRRCFEVGAAYCRQLAKCASVKGLQILSYQGDDRRGYTRRRKAGSECLNLGRTLFSDLMLLVSWHLKS